MKLSFLTNNRESIGKESSCDKRNFPKLAFMLLRFYFSLINSIEIKNFKSLQIVPTNTSDSEKR